MSLINTTVGNYRVTKLLGEGGMGMVYLGEHPVIGRKVAIKVLHHALAADKDIVARFFNEARAIHMIAHANIVEILDFGQTPDGQPYFIMEYLTGEALSELVARGPIPPDDVAAISDQMCRALTAAHAKGIVHRDLKPHNVQLLEREGEFMVKILDFGVAKILAAPDGSQSVKTRTGSLMGTPIYMSPEQCKGAGLLDHRTDIYSLGVMIFEMLASRPPFVAEGIGELFAKHMLEEAPSVLEFAPNTPANMAAAVNKSLSKELDDRFQTMEEFRQALLGETQVVAAPRHTQAAKRSGAIGTRASVPATQTMSPQAQSTTLSSATSEIDDLAPPRRKTGLFVGLGLAGVCAAAFFALGGGKKPVPTPAAKPPVATNTVPTTPPPPEAPKLVTIRFEATPEGAHVFRKSDGSDLGAAPLELQLKKDGPSVDYLIRKDGYKDLPLSMDLDNDHTLHVALEKIAVADPGKDSGDSGKKKPSSGHKPKRKPSGPVPDEDGLATPNF